MKSTKSRKAKSKMEKVFSLISALLRSHSSSHPYIASSMPGLQIIFNQTLQSEVHPVIHERAVLSTISIKVPGGICHNFLHPALIYFILDIMLQYVFYI